MSTRGRSTNEDELRIRSRAIDTATAETKVEAALNKENDRKTEGSFSLPGNTLCRSGSIITLDGFSRFSGRWRIKRAVHRIARDGGYSTAVDFQRVDAKLVEDPTKTDRKKKTKNLAIYRDGKIIGHTTEDN